LTERTSEAPLIGSTLDPQLVDRARKGDLQAFETIVRDRMGAVYRLTFAIVGNEADAADATQETFVSAWRNVRTLRDPERLDAWITRIATNSARVLVRGRRRRGVREVSGLDLASLPRSGELDDGGDRSAADDATLVATALATLDVDARAILAMRHLEGRGIPEIAAILRIPEGTAKSRLFTARKALEVALRREKAE
jgi:RNA polymerase sigma-70 factor (ECF subfamily)